MAAIGAVVSPALAQEFEEIPAMEGDAFEAGAPGMEMGGGEFFSQELGTLLRLRYNTESYGQDQRGNLDIGTMRVANFQDAIAFFDGQATLNDVNGVGYNLGVGFRWLGWNPFPMEPERITGFSFWADGTSTESGNFFPQVGVSYESLGDMWDLRINGYIPVGKESQLGEFQPTGAVSFDQNFLVQEAVADRNTSFNVAEAEIARRIMADRDAWAFAGPYALVNDEQDATGYRVGMRGYAYPDLLVQLAVTDDDIFKTNAAFSVTWFVGRTRSDYRPACGLPDRMREPVMRNDYVALIKTQEVGGDPLTNTAGDPFRFVHVNSAAPNGGDGTFENPLNDVGNVESNSIDDDIVLLYSNSLFSGQNTMVLQDGQRALGEGNGEFFTINTLQQGLVVIPETSPGARDGNRAIIQGAVGTGAVQLADLNEVANFNIDGTGSGANVAGIFSPVTGAGNPNIHDMDFSDVTGTGIQFTPLTRPSETNPAQSTIAGNVTIDDIEFDDMQGVEIDLNLATTTPFPNPLVTLNETISITDVDSQNGSDIGVWLRNTHSGGTATIANYINGTLGTVGSGGGDAATGVLRFEGNAVDEFDGTVTLTNIDIFENDGYAIDYLNIDDTSITTVTTGNGITWDGQGGMAGGMRFDNFNGRFNGFSSTFTNGTLSGLRVEGTSDGIIDLAANVLFSSNDPTAGEAVVNVGPVAGDVFTGTLTVRGNIALHDTGRLISIQRMAEAGTAVSFEGVLTDVADAASTGILIAENSGGSITFGPNNKVTVDTTATNGVTLTNNTGTTISFLNELDITTDGVGATAFEASGGGTLAVTSTLNTIVTNGSTGVDIEGMTIASGDGVKFESVDVTGGTNGIRLVDNTGGPIMIGTLADPVGDGGTITGTTGEAIVVEDSENVTLNSIRVNATAGQTGVRITKESDTPRQITNLNNLEINGGTRGIDVAGDGMGELDLTVNDSAVNSSTEFGMNVNNISSDGMAISTITVNNTVFDGNNASVGAVGVRIANSDATYLFDETPATDNTILREWASTEFLVSGGTPIVTFNGDILNTAGNSVVVENTTGGTVSFSSNSLIDDDGAGLRVTGNSNNAEINFSGRMDFDTMTNDAIVLTNNTGAEINFAPPGANPLDIDTTSGRGFVATGGGTLNVAGLGNTITTTTGRGLVLEDMTIGAVDFESVNVNGADHGIFLEDNITGTVTVGDTGAAVGAGGTIQNTTVSGVHALNTNVTLNGLTVLNAGNEAGENGVEILHTGTNPMTANLNRLTVQVTNPTPGLDGVVIDGIAGAPTLTANIQNLNVDVTGAGLEVTDDVTLSASGTNTIKTTTGVGLNVSNSTITAGGANFTSVEVTAGTSTGILLANLTGGTLQVGTTTGAQNSGGSLTTAGDAIVIQNVESARLNDMRIVNSTRGVVVTHNSTTTDMSVTIDGLNLDGAAGNGMEILADSDSNNFVMRLTGGATGTQRSDLVENVVVTATGAGLFQMKVENTDINVTGATDAFATSISGDATDVEMIVDNSDFVADTGSALSLVTSGGTLKNFDLLVEDSSFMNSSATDSAADFSAGGNVIYSATIRSNTFDNGDPTNTGEDFTMTSVNAQSRVRLNLGGDDVAEFNTASGQGDFILTETAGDFDVFEKDNTFNENPPITVPRNNGDVIPVPNSAAFDNLLVAPVVPVIP